MRKGQETGAGGGPVAREDKSRRIERVLWFLAILGFFLFAETVYPTRLSVPKLEGIAGTETIPEETRAALRRLIERDRDSPSLIQLMAIHWFLFVPALIVITIIGGRCGRGIGLPALFRDSPSPSRRGLFSSAAMWGAVGFSHLVAQAWTVVYYSEWMTNLDKYSNNGDLIKYVKFKPMWGVPLQVFVTVASFPFLVLAGFAMLSPASAAGLDLAPRVRWRQFGRFLVGLLVGMVLIQGAIRAGAAALNHVPSRWLGEIGKAGIFQVHLPWRSHDVFWLKVRHDFSNALVTSGDRGTVLASYAMFVLSLLLIWFLLTVWPGRKVLSPGLGICLSLSIPVIAYSVLITLATAIQLPFVALVLVGFALLNGWAYKYRFPGLEAHYAGPNLRHAKSWEPDVFGPPDSLPGREKTSEEEGVGRRGPGPGRAGERKADHRTTGPLALLQDEEVLEAWRRRWGRGRPRLVLVAVSGGAYRSAFWVTTVLDHLCRRGDLPGFGRSIRLLTGASGGMVGAAYYARLMKASGPNRAGITASLLRDCNYDSLTPIARQLLGHDLPGMIWPYPWGIDRGVVLEREWKSLRGPLFDLAEGEREGWRPSLIFSPMIVETGRRLLISNLNLTGLAETTSELLTQASKPGRRPSDAGRPAHKLYSISAVELFRIFPGVRATFGLQTAVRMNATFPYVSPAVSLPTIPPQRVVDAGYYDNYGVDLATTWAYLNRDWIKANTSGLALIQLRAYRSEEIRKHLYIESRDETHPRDLSGWLAERISTSMQALSTPPEGSLSASAWSMSYRNDEMVRVLDDTFNHDRIGPGRFFETFIFENPAHFAMSWVISDDDIRSMRESIRDDRAPARGRTSDILRAVDRSNAEQIESLAHWWRQEARLGGPVKAGQGHHEPR